MILGIIVIASSVFLAGTTSQDKEFEKTMCGHSKQKNCRLPDVSGDLVQIVSIESWKDTEYIPNINPYCRYRAFVFNPIDPEGNSPRLIVEKLDGGMIGYFVKFQEEIPSLANDRMRLEVKNLNFEASLGCCSFSNVRWDEFSLLYSVYAGKSWDCKIENVNKSRKPICSLSKTIPQKNKR